MAQYSPFLFLSDEILRLLAGSACYAEIAIKTGKEWRDRHLEAAIKGETVKDASYTGLCHRLLKGTIWKPDNCYRSQGMIKNCNITLWLDHPIWGLLHNKSNHPHDINKALRLIKGRITKHVWEGSGLTKPEVPSLRREVSSESIIDVAQYRNLYSLIILTAWAIEARDNKIYTTHYLCAKHLREIFAEVVCRTPQLFIRWPYLAERYMQEIWRPPSGIKKNAWFSPDPYALVDEIEYKENIYRKLYKNLPPKNLMKKLNHKNQYYDAVLILLEWPD